MSTIVINTSDAKEEFTDLINRVLHNKEQIILTRRGKEVAVIISIEEYNLLQSSLDKRDLHDAIDAHQEARTQGTINLEQFKEEQ